MIVVRDPHRLRRDGGGSDVASDYCEHRGFLIAVAIDKCVRLPQRMCWRAAERPGMQLEHVLAE